MNLFKLANIEIKLLMREKLSAFWTFVFPVVMLWLLANITKDINFGPYNAIQIYVPSWIGINIMTISLFTIGVTLTNYRELGILRRYRATPTRPGTILMAHLLYGSLIFLISFILLAAEGMLFFDLSFPKYPISLLLGIMLSLMAMFAFGLFINSLAKTVRQSATISSAILNLMLILSGATIPIYILPEWLQYFAKCLPLYYVIDIIRATWSKVPITQLGTDVAALIVIFFVFGYLGTKTFRWDSN